VSPNPETIRRLRLGDLQKFLRWRYGPILPDDDAGRDDLYEMLLAISLGPEADQKIENAIAIWAPWMDADERLPLIDRINRTPLYLRKPNARALGQKLNLTNQERQALGIRTIAPIDMTDEQMAEQRKARKRARELRRRLARGSKPRNIYLAGSLTRKKPWEIEGISRATWYRRRETGPCPIKLTNSSHTLVSPIKPESQKRGQPIKEGQDKEGKKRARA
jgi:hypothetical protein